jgi:hypothetical protein
LTWAGCSARKILTSTGTSGDTTMSRGKTGKAVVYMRALPSVLLIAVKMVGVFLDFKLSQRSSRKHFRQGLIDAGLTEREADIIAGGFFNGGDEEAKEEV